ncbi:MAG: excinuclease ABC subunit UvrA, partial [Patescibacteria group bacterium]
MRQAVIAIRGARVHNLKNINLDIPRDKLVVMTGLSGSGKSSLAFDTIYAEGQRRYVESLSAYARQFLGLMDKPDVDQIDGLSPAISIDQKTASHNPRSTVGTVTEIYDYLRLLYARVGIPHCPTCGSAVEKQTLDQIVERILSLPKDTKLVLLSPVIKDKKGEHKGVFVEVQKMGYVRVRVDGQLLSIEEALDLSLDKQRKHTIDVVVDRLVVSAELVKDKQRLSESLETALELGNGVVTVELADDGRDLLFSQHLYCPKCDVNLSEIEPRNFSFNSPHGACADCSGLGTRLEVDPNLVIPNKKLSIAEGAIRPWSRTSSNQTWQYRILEAVAAQHGFSLTVPVSELSKKSLEITLYGTGTQSYDVNNSDGRGKVKAFYTSFEGVIPNLERRYRETESDYMRAEIERYMRVHLCPTCQGRRLKPEALAVTVADYSIDKVVAMTIEQAGSFFIQLARERGKGKSNGSESVLTVRQMTIARQVLKEIRSRLVFLNDVGLSYLTLDRTASSLSGGEAQRIRLATQIGSSLVGVIYILDEPSIGLHQRDNDRLIQTLKRLRDLGNTVLVVEHDEETIRQADYVIDIGPGAGEHGGEVVAAGTPAQIIKAKQSITGRYLSGKLRIEVPKKTRDGNGK